VTLTTTSVALDITPLSGTIGAEIRGVDLKNDLEPEVVRSIRDALLQYGVIFFPGQHLQPAEQVAFAANFGELTPAHPVLPGLPGFPEVFEIDYSKTRTLRQTYGDVVDSYDGLSWHTDVTFVERPPLGSILNAVVIPRAGGDTMWSDQRAAYDELSDPLKEFVDGLTAVHDGRQTFATALEQRDGGGDWEGEKVLSLEPVVHPVVRTHPETGRKSLFVNPGFTSHLQGVTTAESDAILQFLYAHSTKPKFTVRYHWSTGDVGFWDNRVTQHSVVGDFGDEPRVIQRVTLRGDQPS
jgi:alpha-ketoglutarate-dependent taurine dioxygenase